MMCPRVCCVTCVFVCVLCSWAMTQLLTSTTTPSFQRVRLVDVSRDGYADLIAVSQSDNQVSVMINNGTGGFGTAKNLTNVTAAWDVSVADVNGDGRMDIGVSGGNCSTNLSFGVYWFQNTGGYPTPSWSSAKTIAVSAPGGYAAQRLSLGDINNDGYSDVVVLWGQVGLHGCLYLRCGVISICTCARACLRVFTERAGLWKCSEYRCWILGVVPKLRWFRLDCVQHLNLISTRWCRSSTH